MRKLNEFNLIIDDNDVGFACKELDCLYRTDCMLKKSPTKTVSVTNTDVTFSFMLRNIKSKARIHCWKVSTEIGTFLKSKIFI